MPVVVLGAGLLSVIEGGRGSLGRAEAAPPAAPAGGFIGAPSLFPAHALAGSWAMN